LCGLCGLSVESWRLAVADKQRQFEWDGSETTAEVFSYAHQLGPRDAGIEARVVPLSREECQALVTMHRGRYPSVLLPEVSETEIEEAKCFVDTIKKRVDELLHGSGRWFVKTNRHSCKDAPPTEADAALFRLELQNRQLAQPLPKGTNPDEIDFGPAFEAFLAARLQGMVVTSGESAVELVVRSPRAHDDLQLQLELETDHFDCYLAFFPFDDCTSPLHEFRCFVTGRQVRCVAQYQYLHRCPIADADMPSAVVSIADYVRLRVLPTLPDNILDVAVDLRCLRVDELWEIDLIELNPLGPGCVWGVMDWKSDKDWLLGRAPPPQPEEVRDSVGGALRSLLVPGPGPDCPPVVARFTSQHPLGLTMGGLAHMGNEMLLVLFTAWDVERVIRDHDAETKLDRAAVQKKGASGTTQDWCTLC